MMVIEFSQKKDEYMVLEEQIISLENDGVADSEDVIRQRLYLGHALPSSDLIDKESR